MVTVALVSRTKYHRATPCIRFILVTRTYERTVQKKKKKKEEKRNPSSNDFSSRPIERAHPSSNNSRANSTAYRPV